MCIGIVNKVGHVLRHCGHYLFGVCNFQAHAISNGNQMEPSGVFGFGAKFGSYSLSCHNYFYF
jgi:hypothetical protein